MTKRLSRAVKKRKRTDWKAAALRLRVEVATLTQDWNKWYAEWEHEFNNKMKLEAELARYRLICDWACQRIEKLECISGTLAAWKEKCTATAGRLRSFEEMFDNLKLQEVGNALNLPLGSTITKEILPGIERLKREKRILLDTLFEVRAENIMQGEDILRQRDELIKLRGVSEERVSCQR